MKKIILSVLLVIGFSSIASAKSKEVIDIEVKQALQQLEKTVLGVNPFIENKAKGVLVIPNIVKAGIGIGGEYGEGALIEHNQTTGYYSYASASFGFQLGIEKKTLIYMFMTEDALNKFKNSDGWKAGVDAGVSIVKFGASHDMSTMNINKPVIVFILGKEGLMYNLTIEGSKISPIKR